MKFKSLKIENWKQFDAIDIEFHDRLTVLTGANASGKTTLLNILGQHFGWNIQELSTPRKDEAAGEVEYCIPVSPPFGKTYQRDIGYIAYSDGNKARVSVFGSDMGAGEYPLRFYFGEDFKGLEGLYIPSDRPEFVYRQVTGISFEAIDRRAAFSSVSNCHRQRMSGGGSGQHPNICVPSKRCREIYQGFEDVLGKILPEELGFERLELRESEIVFITKSGEFMIEAVSGGIGALIDLAWQIYMFPESSADAFVVLIDEAETHLHATMQRRLLPSFLATFPKVQFIVSTHSPLILSSVKDSSVYILKHNDRHRVESEEFKIADKARGAADILRDVLGVSFTMPVWVEEKLNKINEKYLEMEIDENTFALLRKELAEVGLEDLVPQSIHTILSSK